MQYVGITADRATAKYYFEYHGQTFGNLTQVQFTEDFSKRMSSSNPFFRSLGPHYSCFCYVADENGKIVWHFSGFSTEDFIPSRDIERIVTPKPYKTDKDRIKEKKEKGKTWEYIWPGTLVYIFCMIFITVFKERLWGWIAATILYNNYCYEKLSK